MKRTFQLVSAALLLTVASVTVQAQGGGGGGMGGVRGGRGSAMQREALFKDITLTPAQTASVDSIFKGADEKSVELRKDVQQGTPMPPELVEKMMAVTTDRNAALKKVLTADQVTMFDKNLAAMPQRRGRGGF